MICEENKRKLLVNRQTDRQTTAAKEYALPSTKWGIIRFCTGTPLLTPLKITGSAQVSAQIIHPSFVCIIFKTLITLKQKYIGR